MNDLVLKIHSMGLTRVPSTENPSEREYQRYLGELLSLETGMTVAIRFEIGNTLIDLGIEPGEKFLFCQKHFGERASMMMECMKIAREWVFNQNVGWSWSHYRTIYTRSKQDKLDLIKQYKEKRIRSIKDLQDAVQRMDTAIKKPAVSPNRDQIVHVHDLKQEEPSFIEAQYKPDKPALPPPPNTINEGPWCACGEPVLPDSKFCAACWKAYRERDVQQHSDPVADFFAPPQTAVPASPVVSFNVEGNSVQQGTYQPPARPVAAIALDNGRPVILFNHAVRTDDPEIDHIRCVVPAGICLKEGDLFTVAVIRCQMP